MESSSNGINVLMVDDDPVELESAQVFLEREHPKLNIKTITHGIEALKNLNNKDIVVSDYQMPGMNGLELLEAIRENKNNEIPFIIFTSKGREEVAMKALNLGANGYLKKEGKTEEQYENLAETIKQEYKHWKTERERKKMEQKIREKKEKYTNIFEALPTVTLVVDPERRVREINMRGENFADRPREDMIGKRGGTALRCVHHLDDPKGCGFSSHCEDCTVRNTVLDSLETGESYFRKKAHLTVEKDDQEKEFDLKVSTSPISISGENRVIVSLENIDE